jgi:hypothetical protein
MSWGTRWRYVGYASGKVASMSPSSRWILISTKNETNRQQEQPVSESDQQDRTEQHSEQARIDRMARDAVGALGPKPVLDLDHGRGTPHRAQCDAGPEGEGS